MDQSQFEEILGSPAYPIQRQDQCFSGQTLLDFFAAAALPAIIAAQAAALSTLPVDGPKTCAKLAYDFANEMLKERVKDFNKKMKKG